MGRMDRQRVACWIAAVLSPVAALVVRMALSPWLTEHGAYTPFIVPVALSAWCGGWTCGITALLISSFFAYSCLVPQGHPTHLSLLVLFIITNVPVVLFSELLHRANRIREAKTRALEESDRAKDRMIAHLAHELRNPLNGVTMALRLLRLRAEAGGDTVRPQAVAEVALRQMSRLIDDLTDVSRLARGRVQLRYQSFDLCELLENLFPAFEEAAREKGVVFTGNCADSPQVFGDPVRLSQVFANLINNAVKFTDAGEVYVQVVTDPHSAFIMVQDTGVGIPPSVLPYIWEPFRQGSLEDGRGGLGLGLSIVKGLVEQHGGVVSVSSEVGKGTVFVVELPLEEGLTGRRGGADATLSSAHCG
jgi:signal transduction histidine kinase